MVTNFWRTVLKPLSLLSTTFKSCNSQASLKKYLKELKIFLSEGFNPVWSIVEMFLTISLQNICLNSSSDSIIACIRTLTIDMYSAEFFGRFSRILEQTSLKCIERLICCTSFNNWGRGSAGIFFNFLMRVVTLFKDESLVEVENSNNFNVKI